MGMRISTMSIAKMKNGLFTSFGCQMENAQLRASAKSRSGTTP